MLVLGNIELKQCCERRLPGSVWLKGIAHSAQKDSVMKVRAEVGWLGWRSPLAGEAYGIFGCPGPGCMVPSVLSKAFDLGTPGWLGLCTARRREVSWGVLCLGVFFWLFFLFSFFYSSEVSQGKS